MIACKKRVDVSYLPVFKGAEIGDQTIVCGEPWSLKIPEYTDAFGAIAKFKINLDKLAAKLTYDEENQKIMITNPDTSFLPAMKEKIKLTF